MLRSALFYSTVINIRTNDVHHFISRRFKEFINENNAVEYPSLILPIEL